MHLVAIACRKNQPAVVALSTSGQAKAQVRRRDPGFDNSSAVIVVLKIEELRSDRSEYLNLKARISLQLISDKFIVLNHLV